MVRASGLRSLVRVVPLEFVLWSRWIVLAMRIPILRRKIQRVLVPFPHVDGHEPISPGVKGGRSVQPQTINRRHFIFCPRFASQESRQ
ncbi:hypothetical protein QBC33DRAFT_520978 [Phialemonium atrogriseum]|uniref:Uncharacterized protein n=1 Tax=Phialemonium atrogriseum TaxID=1093897 RepID=A0AAJ0C8Y8_9PEZI|nr:uncharacterized protein QBC33DRAFT_520978 [Phialemonium atrogriseum]KAK1772359.1 hypothetical protein QBC33DRAFT_520978 [Phialemonium atrogriseum]